MSSETEGRGIFRGKWIKLSLSMHNPIDFGPVKLLSDRIMDGEVTLGEQ
jgi:hypothetical protein